MKLKHTLSLLSLATCAALSTSAFAQTVTFNGEIVDSACAAVAGSSNVVTLPQQAVSDFPADGAVAGLTAFKVVLTGCKPLNKTFAVNFSSPGNIVTGGYLGTIGAGGLAYELLNSSGAHINFTAAANSSTGGFDTNTPNTGVVTTSGPHELNYQVQYIKPAGSAAVTAGTTTQTAMMTVQYN